MDVYVVYNEIENGLDGIEKPIFKRIFQVQLLLIVVLGDENWDVTDKLLDNCEIKVGI